jgi:hypothetical protein
MALFAKDERLLRVVSTLSRFGKAAAGWNFSGRRVSVCKPGQESSFDFIDCVKVENNCTQIARRARPPPELSAGRYFAATGNAGSLPMSRGSC